MNRTTLLLITALMPVSALACGSHFGTSVPHIYDEEHFLLAVDKQADTIKELSLEEMLNGAVAPSPEVEQKNKFMEYYQNNVLNKKQS